jgi:carboxylate-amine ligase
MGANAAWHEGRDSGMASVRPLICGTLPRQGVPPAYASWRQLADDLSWGVDSGRLSTPLEWWWELRLHPQLGTLEVRVPDAQSCVEDAAAMIATVCSLVLWLAQRHDAGELPGPSPSWRIAENRWSAARRGVDGGMVDLQTGASSRTSERLHVLLDTIAPLAPAIGADAHLRHAHSLAERNGASRQRMIAERDGAKALVDHLANLFVESGGVGDDALDAAPGR